MIRDADVLLERLRHVHEAIRDAVVAACERQGGALETLALPVADEGGGGEGGGGDTIFALDRVSEEALHAHFDEIARTWPCVLIAEGLGGSGRIVLPRGSTPKDAQLTVIVDPIDGTRGLMYQKRPAWILTGVAPARGGGDAAARLSDIELALQTEIPLVKQHLSDSLWVVNGAVGGERYNRLTGERSPVTPRPSGSSTLDQGFGGLARFFPGGRELLAAIDDAVVERVVGSPPQGRALAFEDQYISTGGQLYELMMGHDRWIADLRPLVYARDRGTRRLCCHPYDLCTESIARAAGVVVSDERGERLSAPLDVTSDVAWIGFANAALRQAVFPVLQDALAERGLLNTERKDERNSGRGRERNGGRNGEGNDGDAVAEFVTKLRASGQFFQRDADVVIARAPGRLDVMGGIADYSGSLVLELPLAAATFAAAQLTSDGDVTVRTLCAAELNVDDTVCVALDGLVPHGKPVDYPTARALLSTHARRRWAAYVAGALVVLTRDFGAHITRGVRVLVDSDVPPSKGVGSSAALEVAAMQALCALIDVQLDPRALALACQRVENLVVGAPCGVMDQMTSSCGQAERLLAIVCQPAEIVGHTRIPPELELWGIDSGIRHAVGGSEYGDVRIGAFMGYRIIADLAGLPVSREDDRRVRITDDQWHGYLANVTPSEWERTYRDYVPSTIEGHAFLAGYGGISDAATTVDPLRTYAVRQATAHPIHENHRVQLFRALLESGARTESDRQLLGELMYQSHASYSACGLGSDGTDRLVELVRAGESHGLYGAKITGGGSGGVVAVLGRAGSRPAVESIARHYERDTGRPALVLGGSSSGAGAFGVRRERVR